MKVRLLPLAIGAAIAMPGIALADGPTVYGKMNVAFGMESLDYGYNAGYTTTDNSSDRWLLTSYDSRLGVKGSETISDSLSAIYVAEFGIDVDDGTGLSQRNIYVGLKGGWGQLVAGKMDTPLKSSQGKIDQFGDTTGDIKHVFVGENRADNVVAYATPSISGFQATVAIIPGEQVDSGTNAKNGPADATSVSVTYTMDGLYAAVAADSYTPCTAYTGVKADLSDLDKDSYTCDTTRLVGVYTMDALQVGAMYQTATTRTSGVDFDQDGFLLSVGYKIDAIKLKAQYGATTLSDNISKVDNDATLIAVGADYILSKQTNLYVHYTSNTYKYDNAGAVAVFGATSAKDQTRDVVDFGIVHNF